MKAYLYQPRGPKLRGHCAVCGFEGSLNKYGVLRGHLTRRVGSDGQPYVATDDCLGAGEPSLPFEAAATVLEGSKR